MSEKSARAVKVRDVAKWLQEFAPSSLAEEWDNVGLLIGDPDREVRRLMTSLTLSLDVAQEAIDEKADLVVTHHPIPFKPVRRITTESTSGAVIWKLAGAGISVLSPHTAFDSTRDGINEQLAGKLGLVEIVPLLPSKFDTQLGAGRVGLIPKPISVSDLARIAKASLGLGFVEVAGDTEKMVGRVAVACGSGGSFLERAVDACCDALVTGEATFHTCLEAASRDTPLILVGHFASERFAVQWLADKIQGALQVSSVWASARERDPIRRV